MFADLCGQSSHYAPGCSGFLRLLIRTITQTFAPGTRHFRPHLTLHDPGPGLSVGVRPRTADPGPGISLILIMQRSLVISNGLRHSTLRDSGQSQASSGSRDLSQPIRDGDTLLISSRTVLTLTEQNCQYYQNCFLIEIHFLIQNRI